jgi:hypothetical protein
VEELGVHKDHSHSLFCCGSSPLLSRRQWWWPNPSWRRSGSRVLCVPVVRRRGEIDHRV